MNHDVRITGRIILSLITMTRIARIWRFTPPPRSRFQCWLVNWSSCKPPGRSLSQPGLMEWSRFPSTWSPFLGDKRAIRWSRPTNSWCRRRKLWNFAGSARYNICCHQSSHKYTHKPNVHQGSLIRFNFFPLHCYTEKWLMDLPTDGAAKGRLTNTPDNPLTYAPG